MGIFRYYKIFLIPSDLYVYRSEDMELYQVTMSKDDSWQVMNELGNMGVVHFVDLNKNEQPFHLPYANQIKRTEETLKKLSYILFCSSNI